LSDKKNYSKLSAWRKYGITPKDAVDKLSRLHRGSPWNQAHFHEALYRSFVQLDKNVTIFYLTFQKS
jgi:hypothetical protein